MIAAVAVATGLPWPLSAVQASLLLLGPVVVAAAFLSDRFKSAARESVRDRQRTAEILESIQDGLVSLDREFRFTYVNRAAEILLSKSKTTLLGKNVWEVYPELVGSIAEANARRALGQRIPLHFEYRHPASNKRTDVSLYPTSDAGVTVYFRDTICEKAARTTLRENEERYRFNLEAAKVGTWEWNIATGEDCWSENMESIHGISPGSFHGTIE